MPKRKFELKTSTAEKRPAFETQKRKKNEQDTSSAAPKKIWKYNKKQNNVASSTRRLQRYSRSYEDYNATQEDHEDNNIPSRVSLSDDESDNGSVSSQVSSPDYDNNETISPHTVSSIHENNETTSPHPVTSSGHENDVSQEDDISLPIQRSGNIINFSDQIRTPYQENNLLQKRPAQFQQADNEFEIALWVAHHKRILDLATNIRNGMMTRIDDGDERQVTTSVSSMLYEPTLKPPEIDQHIKFQLQEECKALFLRTRNNSTVLYEEIIVRICKITKADSRLGTLARDVGRWFNTYRYNFHIAVVKLANEFRALNESAQEPYDELDEFVTNDVWKQLLQMHLKATDQTKLKKNSEIFTKLRIFVYQVIKTVLIAQDKHKDTQNGIRKCDEYTIDLEIPTKFEIVKSLPVRELLDC